MAPVTGRDGFGIPVMRRLSDAIRGAERCSSSAPHIALIAWPSVPTCFGVSKGLRDGTRTPNQPACRDAPPDLGALDR